MTLPIESFAQDFDPKFKIFHELMARKVRDVLLVSTPYDAWIMEEDCRLSERIINEYRGLNLSNPPRITWVPTVDAALAALTGRKFTWRTRTPATSAAPSSSATRTCRWCTCAIRPMYRQRPSWRPPSRPGPTARSSGPGIRIFWSP
jgi:hypothetical protein